MKKLLIVSLVSALLIASAMLASGFVSTSTGYPGKCDVETTWYIAGDTILQGQVLSMDMAYNAYTTGTYDTGSVAIRSSAENDTWVAGIALMDALPQQSVKVVTRGVVAAKVDGSDSRQTAAAISYGYPLSTADRDGFLGSIDADSSASTQTQNTDASVQWSYGELRLNAVAFFLESNCAITDTGALTTYDVYIDVRSR